jgi:hypothetical protein
MSSKETQQPNVFIFQQTNSETEPYNFSRKQANMYRPLWNQEKNEAEALRRRIIKREEEEARREREQVLTGKLKPSETYIKTDKVIQIQQKMRNIELKSREISVAKIKKPPVKMKWQYAVHKLHISPPVNKPMFTTVDKDDIKQGGMSNDTNIGISEEKQEQALNGDNALKIRLENNPVFKSFENVNNVDDLYRIAEIWVNPCYKEK